MTHLQSSIHAKKNAIIDLATQHGAHDVRLFGSVARGEEKPQSDIDFLVHLDPDRSLFDRIRLKQALEDLLGRKVDVVPDTSLHWYIRDRVLAEAIPL